MNKEYNDPDYFSKNYELEPVTYLNEHTYNQTDVDLGIIYMKRKIEAVINSCRAGCTATDLFIAAALGQGSGFTPQNMSEISNPNPDDPADLYKIPVDERGVSINWLQYFIDRRKPRATTGELTRFRIAVQGLVAKGWALPPEPINWQYVDYFQNWSLPQPRPR
ncbi:MAG: hypothetical protein IT314_15550 [Anaerolineales bacterium]|nr:hypothetical protein [Anaerolineales bacterium]